MVKFCPECAHPIIDDKKPFCPKCGNKLPITSPEGKLPENQPSAVTQPERPSWYIPPVNSVSTSVQTQAPQSPTKESTTKKRSIGEWTIIVCGGIILLLILSAFINGFIAGISGSTSSSHQDVIFTKDLSSMALTINDFPIQWQSGNPSIQKDSYENVYTHIEGLSGDLVRLRIQRYSTIELAKDAYNSQKGKIIDQYKIESTNLGNEGFGYVTSKDSIIIFRKGNIIVRTQYGVGIFGGGSGLSINDAKKYAQIVNNRIN